VSDVVREKDDWIQTYSGRVFWPLDPKAEEMDIEDIAHSLSHQCRFSGHAKVFYSVANHSILVSEKCKPENALWGLLHDASEAYLVDVPRPIKHASRLGSEYRRIEKLVMQVVCEKYGLPVEEPPDVREADNLLLSWEQRDLMAPPPIPWHTTVPVPFIEKIKPLTPEESKKLFLKRFHKLIGTR
jgi:uncharacterized protein